MDQLLAGGATPPTAAPAPTADAPADPTPALPGILDIGLKLQASAPADVAPQGVDLLAALTKELDALKDQLDAGDTPDPGLLKQLGQTADALAALIAAPPAPAATPAVAAPAALDPVQAIGATPPVDPAVPVPAPVPADQPAPIFASLVSSPAPGDADDTSAPASSSPAPSPLPALAELAQKLSSIGQSIAARAPDIAQRLETLGSKIEAAVATPQLLAQLVPAPDPAGTSLDSIVRSLLDAKPVLQSQPAQLAATAMPLPAPPPSAKATSGDEPKPDLDVKPSADTPAAPSAKLALAVKSPAAAIADSAPKPEIKPATPDPAPAKSDAPPAEPSAAAVAAPSAPVAPRAIPAAYQAAQNPINMGQVAFEMVRQIHQGNSRFSIRLDPPELGRVDVRMHVDATGAVTARLTVERSETLDMFQRDRGTLEKALGQAGLDTGKTSLEFSLKQNPFAGMAGGDQRQQPGANAGAKFALSREEDTPIPSVTLYRGAVSSGGVNLFV